MPNLAVSSVVAGFVSVSLLWVIGVYQPAESATPMKDRETCKYWQAKVDPSITLPKDTANTNEDSTVDLSFEFEISEEEASKVLDATECLLKLKGKTSPSNFSSMFGLNHSSRFPPPTIEVVALYYISSLYHKTWRHSNGIILTDRKGKKNTKKSIQTAYKAYQAWFERVKEIGLEKAREQGLDPLDGTGVRWY